MEAVAPRRRAESGPDRALDRRAAHPNPEGAVISRILAYTSPAAGHLFALTPILDELADRGHQITCGPWPPRRQLDLTPLDQVDDMFRRPPLVLYLTAEPFEYLRRDWPENIVMVGPCDWDPPSEPPGWLDEISGPIVLVTTSSEFQDDGRLVQTALDGLTAEPVTVVATFRAADPARFNVPANARVVRFIPHGQVLERAVCAVTHGGMGATQKALAHGVPVCVVPFGRDQLEVARRVEVAQAGTRLSARRLRPDRLRDKVHEAINRTTGAKRIAAAFATSGGGPGAVDAIETRLLGLAPDIDHDVTQTQ